MRRILLPVVLAAIVLVPLVSSHGLASWGFAATAAAPAGDEFNNNSFVAPFVVKCGAFATAPCPDPQGATTWSLNGQQPGFLRIMTQFGSLVGSSADSSNNARNFVVQPSDPAADYTVTTRLVFPGGGAQSALNLGQTAGLLVYQDDDHFISFGRVIASTGQPQIQFRQEDGTNTLVSSVTEVTPLPSVVYLRITKTGTLYEASYSYDNQTFIPVLPQASATATPTATGTATTTATETTTATATDTPQPTNTAIPTDTPTDTPTATATATHTPTVTSTSTAVDTATPTVTQTPTATATATTGASLFKAAQVRRHVSPRDTTSPTGYTATYAAPFVGVFAWGGTNAAVINNVLPADFDWFRVGLNSLTPVPTSTPGATSTPTATITAVATSTPTSTVVPTATPTATSAPTSTPIPIPTATPKPQNPAAEFSYVSVWYSNIHIGDKQHVQIQAKHHSKQGIWTLVQFGTGKQLAYYEETDSNGFWQKDFQVPNDTISQYTPQAVVTFQLWKGSTTDMMFARFKVIR